MGTTEFVTGTLKGMGFLAECRLMARRNPIQTGSGPAYVRCAVLEAPLYLPDGYYEVSFCAHTAFLHKASGGWTVGVPWRQPRQPEDQKRLDPEPSAITDLPEFP